MSSKRPPCCKIVLLGDSGVGKTCLISRYLCGTFDNSCPTTNGASYASKELILENNEKIVLDIWDTAGQEKYKSLTRFFYKDASAAILVYDITKKETFTNLKTYWVQQLKDYGTNNIIIAIAGNKSDLYDKEQVSEDEAKEFADSIGASFELTSAKSNSGVNDLYMAVAETYLKKGINNKNQEKEDIKLKKEDVTKTKKRKCC